MGDTLFAILTNPSVRDAEKVEAQLSSDFRAGRWWWGANQEQ